MSSISTSTSHTLDPAAIGHDHDEAPAKGTSTLQAAPTTKSNFSGRELVYAAVLLASLLAITFGTAAGLAIGVWVFHWLFHTLFSFLNEHHIANLTARDAEAWGNAIGTVSVIVLGFVMILATLLT